MLWIGIVLVTPATLFVTVSLLIGLMYAVKAVFCFMKDGWAGLNYCQQSAVMTLTFALMIVGTIIGGALIAEHFRGMTRQQWEQNVRE